MSQPLPSPELSPPGLPPAFPDRAAWGTAGALRAWQTAALAQYFADEPRDFLAVATPGAGKTSFALAVAGLLLAGPTLVSGASAQPAASGLTYTQPLSPAALTQVQEPTLAFLPKLVAMALVLLLSGPAIGGAMNAYAEALLGRIVSAGGMP